MAQQATAGSLFHKSRPSLRPPHKRQPANAQHFAKENVRAVASLRLSPDSVFFLSLRMECVTRRTVPFLSLFILIFTHNVSSFLEKLHRS